MPLRVRKPLSGVILRSKIGVETITALRGSEWVTSGYKRERAPARARGRTRRARGNCRGSILGNCFNSREESFFVAGYLPRISSWKYDESLLRECAVVSSSGTFPFTRTSTCT